MRDGQSSKTSQIEAFQGVEMMSWGNDNSIFDKESGLGDDDVSKG